MPTTDAKSVSSAKPAPHSHRRRRLAIVTSGSCLQLRSGTGPPQGAQLNPATRTVESPRPSGDATGFPDVAGHRGLHLVERLRKCAASQQMIRPMARTNPFQFIQQVRAEAARIVWPTRRETGLTTVMVMIMATLFATFFFTVDLIVRFALEQILNFAS
jgi:preprotein translocase subunit SecE